MSDVFFFFSSALRRYRSVSTSEDEGVETH